MQFRGRVSCLFLVACGLTVSAEAENRLTADARQGPAELLVDTGLFSAGTTTIAPGVVSYSPQYPLWSDGATKRRWLLLPPGTAIDATRADAWELPPGTRVWKEFSHGKRVETRLIERLADGSWRYGTYVWNDEQTEARLAPDAGIAALEVSGAPLGSYRIPSQDDCRACHEGAVVPVLGIGALQLSPDRDPNAPHAEAPLPDDVDLDDLVELGLLVNLPRHLLDAPPRIDASSPAERSAFGYLHANCGHCHNDSGPLSILGLSLAQDADGQSSTRTLDSLIDRPSEYRLGEADVRVVAGDASASVLALRMRSRRLLSQMPPLGTRRTDAAGVALIEQWIEHDLLKRQENPR